MMNNFYKMLDVRSNGLQQNEKNFITPKYFISSLVETEKEIKINEKDRKWHKLINKELFMPIKASHKNKRETQFLSPNKNEKEDEKNIKPKSLRKISTNQKNQKQEEEEENQMYNSFVKLNNSFTNNSKKLEEEEEEIKNQNEKILEEENIKEDNQSEYEESNFYLERHLPFTNSLMKLLGHSNPFHHTLKYPLSRSRYSNPIKIFSMKDIYVIQDSIFFAKVSF